MGLGEKHRITGGLQLILRDIRDGRIVLQRRAHNSIMDTGSQLVAGLFCGEVTEFVKAAGVGLADTTPDDHTLTGLADPVKDSEEVPVRALTHMAMGAASYVTFDPATRSAIVKLAATFAADQANGRLVEAGLFNSETGGTLYNRVIFEPINKSDTHELTLIWEITFSM